MPVLSFRADLDMVWLPPTKSTPRLIAVCFLLETLDTIYTNILKLIQKYFPKTLDKLLHRVLY